MNHHLDPIFLRAFSLKASFLEEGRLRGWRKFHGSTCCFASSMTWTARGGLTFSGNLPIFWVKHELFQISNMIHVSSFGFFREFFCAFLGWTVPFFGGTFDSFFSNNPNHPTKPTQLFPLRFHHRVVSRSLRFGETSRHPNDGKADADGIRKDLIPEDLSLVAKVEDYPPGN